MSKGVAVLVAGLGAIVLPVLLVVVVAVIFHKEMIDSIYKNVEDINDGEMPPTVTSFQSGPEVVSTIGGSGEGLNGSEVTTVWVCEPVTPMIGVDVVVVQVWVSPTR